MPRSAVFSHHRAARARARQPARPLRSSTTRHAIDGQCRSHAAACIDSNSSRIAPAAEARAPGGRARAGRAGRRGGRRARRSRGNRAGTSHRAERTHSPSSTGKPSRVADDDQRIGARALAVRHQERRLAGGRVALRAGSRRSWRGCRHPATRSCTTAPNAALGIGHQRGEAVLHRRRGSRARRCSTHRAD